MYFTKVQLTCMYSINIFEFLPNAIYILSLLNVNFFILLYQVSLKISYSSPSSGSFLIVIQYLAFWTHFNIDDTNNIVLCLNKIWNWSRNSFSIQKSPLVTMLKSLIVSCCVSKLKSSGTQQSEWGPTILQMCFPLIDYSTGIPYYPTQNLLYVLWK